MMEFNKVSLWIILGTFCIVLLALVGTHCWCTISGVPVEQQAGVKELASIIVGYLAGVLTNPRTSNTSSDQPRV